MSIDGAVAGFAPSPLSPVTVKGTAVVALAKFVEDTLTAEERERALASLSPEDRRLFDRHLILPVDLFPLAAVNRFTIAAAREKGLPPEVFGRRVGRYAAETAVRGPMRYLAALLTPAALLARASRLWSTIYSRGEMSVEVNEPAHAVLVLKDFPSEDVGCGRITGWMEKLTELTRVKDVHARHIDCVARGAAVCRWDVRWR
ncbi:MAG TPA: hypothetical protein VKB93_15515 [Thermoanaerobaculia bacterium]|nr:hypothetical protein [Thermoanaerobaculia bacterium]